MTDSPPLDKRRNKKIIVNNSTILKEYALYSKENLGIGIIIINLLRIKNDILTEKDISYSLPSSDDDKSLSLQQAIAYIPLKNFWFKIIRLKIKKKYDIDIKKDYDLENKFLIIFVKDSDLESFSIYSVKLK